MQGHDVKGARGAVRTLTLLVYVPTQASDASPVAPRLLRRAFMSPRKLVPSLLVITCTAPWQRSGASFRRGVCCHARPRHALVRDSVARGERRSPSHHRDRLARIMRYDYERLCGPPRDGSYPVPRIPYPVSRIPYPVPSGSQSTSPHLFTALPSKGLSAATCPSRVAALAISGHSSPARFGTDTQRSPRSCT
jgi:hypothetical protein